MMRKAEVTAFLSLVFILLVTFIGSVMDVTSLQVAKNYRRMDAERAIECVFAEYQKELLQEYDVFAMDMTYESGEYSEDLLHKRLNDYGLVNSENKIETIEFLSDGNGKVFYRQAIRYMEHKYGIDSVKEYLGMTDDWKQQEEEVKNYKEEEAHNSSDYMESLKNLSILKLVMPDGKTVSEKTLQAEELPSHRQLNKGYGQLSRGGMNDGSVQKLLFGEYLLEHFYSAVDESEHVLDYELEYLLAGRMNDRENLKAVVNKLMAVRFVPNYSYLQGDAQKRAEAEALAVTLSAAAAVPGAIEALKQGILLAWAFGESAMDLRNLLDGNKVPLMKDTDTWQLSLSGLMKLKETGSMEEGTHVKEGVGYEDYLRMLLFLEQKEDLAMRCLDLIEQNLNEIQGLDFFKVDFCMTSVKMTCTCSFRRNVQYTFPISFEYQ